jgi:hypothetical protein
MNNSKGVLQQNALLLTIFVLKEAVGRGTWAKLHNVKVNL